MSDLLVSKRILFIDFQGTRRETQIRVLQRSGYEVVVRDNYVESETLDNEGHFDLVLLTLHRKELEGAAAYSERLRKAKPDLPILLLTDYGVFVPRGTLSPQVETGDPGELMREIASMIAGSSHIREIGTEDFAFPAEPPSAPAS